MQFQPDLDEFLKQADNHEVIAVSAEFTADAETPLSAYAKLSSEKPAFLFESVVGGECQQVFVRWFRASQNHRMRSIND